MCIRDRAWVIRNRADNPRWWGNDITDVCLKKYQFSCWNHNDPNYPRLTNEATRVRPDFQAGYVVCTAVLEKMCIRDRILTAGLSRRMRTMV